MTITIKDDEIGIPILRLKKKEFERLPRNKRLAYNVLFKINKKGVIEVGDNRLCIALDIIVPGSELREES